MIRTLATRSRRRPRSRRASFRGEFFESASSKVFGLWRNEFWLLSRQLALGPIRYGFNRLRDFDRVRSGPAGTRLPDDESEVRNSDRR